MPLSKVWAGSLVLLAAVSLPLQAASPVKVGSKIDTEGALLGNIILQVLESHGVPTVNKVQLGTTPVVRGAITSGELDIYPEYTGNGAFFFKDENDTAWKNAQQGYEKVDAPRDKCTLSCAINGIHAAFHYLKKNYISGCVMTVPTGW